MTRDDVIRMAREAGILAPQYRDHVEQLERFAALVAAAEREACAVVCDDFEHSNWGYMQGSVLCAAAIRARTTP